MTALPQDPPRGGTATGRPPLAGPALPRRAVRAVSVPLLGAALSLLAGCPNDSSVFDSSNPNSAFSTTSGTSTQYAQKCAPANTDARNTSGALLSGYQSGSLADEKNFVRAYMNEAYLWYREIPSVDASLAAYSSGTVFDSLGAYFDALKTPAKTVSGKYKDQFSFIYPTADWQQLSQSGVVYGYGIDWTIGSTTAPRNIRVAYTTPNSQAATLGVVRGDKLVSVTIDGVTASADSNDAAGIDRLNQSLFPEQVGKSIVLQLQDALGTPRSVTVVSAQVATQPVLRADVMDIGGAKVGYLLFNDFILPGEGQLKTAFQTFQTQGVTDLVLDLRYNGGGYLYMAAQLAYMIAGPARTSNKIFERTSYNDKRSAETNDPNNPEPFYDTSSGIAGSGTVQNSPLPTLNLPRVYVLSSKGTCSASESVINGLRGVDVQVNVVGAATCGKPYGFMAKDNCGISYFPIEFQGVNAKGFGDFADGFQPTCTVADDLAHQLGDINEGQLAAALGYRASNQCPAGGSSGDAMAKSSGDRILADGLIARIPARMNKYLLP